METTVLVRDGIKLNDDKHLYLCKDVTKLTPLVFV